MSVIHPGSSINFDAATLQQNEDEDEMLQEELRQQKELRELLSAELSDDLLDDDHSSVNDSHQSLPQDVSSEQQPVNSPIITSTTSVTQGWMQGAHMTQPITSTPGDELHNGYYEGQMNGYDYGSQDHYGHNYANANGQEQYYDPSYGVVTSQPQQWHHQQDYENNIVYQEQRDDGVGPYMQYNQNGGKPHNIPQGYQYGERGEVEGREDYGDIIDGNRLQQQQRVRYRPERNGITSSLSQSPGSKSSYPRRMKIHPNQNQPEHRKKGHGSQHDVPTEGSPMDSDNHVVDKLQNEFDEVTNDLKRDDSGRQMAQLQILYKARGKKIDELNHHLEDLKSETARDKRIVNHQLAMAKDQKDGMGTSLEESQRLVQSKGRQLEEMEGKLNAQVTEIENLKSSKNELVTKIQVSERTIESLHEQLTQLSHSEAIERAKEQHDTVLSATTRRHEMQILELTTQLDECRQEMNEKGEELEKLRFHLNKISRESEQMLLDKTETINRLTKSLEDAQNQCQGLLSGSNENAFARHQVSDLLRERKQNEEEMAYLKMQVTDAENHLKLYENALQLGAGESRNPGRHSRGGNLSASLSELVCGNNDIARKLDWKSPQVKFQDFEAGSQGELIDGLRRELQRALKCNKVKRDEVTKLKLQCSELEEESSHWRTRADEAQTQLKKNASVPSGKQEKNEDVRQSASIQELEEKFRQAEEKVEMLEKTCNEVKQRMADMIQEHDQDKQDAVERCERALMQLHEDAKQALRDELVSLMQLHEDAKQALRDELVSEREQKMYEMSVDHDAKMREISAEIEQLQHELHDVKQSYVHVCAEKDNVQSSVQEQLLDQFEKEKETILSEHQDAIKKLETALVKLENARREKIKERDWREVEWDKEREKLTQDLKEMWEKEKESEFTQRVETLVALAKVNWFEEFSSSKQKAIHTAMKVEEEKWTTRIDELKRQFEKQRKEETKLEMDKCRKEWLAQKEIEIKNLHEEFQSDKEAAIKTATCMAELNKNLQKEGLEAELEKKIREVEAAKEKDKEDFQKNARDAWMQEQENLIRDAVEETKRGLDEEMKRERQTQISLMEKAVLEVRKVFDQEKQSALKQKTSDMEKEIKKLQEQHRKDYDKFVVDHKKTLASFLEREKARSHPNRVCKDASAQVETGSEDSFEMKEKSWKSEKNEIENKTRNEIAKTQRKYEERFEELRKEIHDLMTEKNNLTIKLQSVEQGSQINAERAELELEKRSSKLKLENEKSESRVAETEAELERLREQQKDDVNKLKERMREEYRRWKKERATLISRLKENTVPQPSNDIQTPSSPSRCKFCQNTHDNNSQLLKQKDEATKQAVTELGEVYTGTLKMIKGEMMSFIGESRLRTKEAIAHERRKTASKMKSHYTKHRTKSNTEKQIATQDLQRLKVFESGTESRPDTPVLNVLSSQPTSTKPPTVEAPPLLCQTYSNAGPITLMERYLNGNDYSHYPTKLTPADTGNRCQPHQRTFTLRGPASHPRRETTYTPELSIKDIAYTRGSAPQPRVLPHSSSPHLSKVTVRSRDRQPPIANYHPHGIDLSPRRAGSDGALPEFSRTRNFPTSSTTTPSLGGTYKPKNLEKR